MHAGIRKQKLLKPSGAAHGAVVARFAAGFHTALFFFFKKIYELADCCFFNTKLFLTGM